MAKVILLFVLSASLYAFCACAPQLFEGSRCGEREVFQECPRCVRTCRNIFRGTCFLATCQPSCVCLDQYVRGPDGRCITVAECPAPDEDFHGDIVPLVPLK